MKNPQAKLPNEKAQKELKQFSIAGLVCSAIALFLFWWLAIASLAFSVCALVLSKHKGNSKNPDLKKYTIFAIAGLVLGIIDFALHASQK